MRVVGLFAMALVLGQTAPVEPPLPYVDHGACPFECCTYRDWTAEQALQAFDSHGLVPASQHRAFRIASGERVTGMTGVVITRKPGLVRVETPLEIEVYSSRFPKAKPQRLTLASGDRLYLLTNLGEGYMSGWFKGRVLESFDTFAFGSAEDCPKLKRGCSGIIEQRPESEWWVKVRNRAGRIGWVLVPKNAPGFARMDACGG
jgi:hypothetical protein